MTWLIRLFRKQSLPPEQTLTIVYKPYTLDVKITAVDQYFVKYVHDAVMYAVSEYTAKLNEGIQEPTNVVGVEEGDVRIMGFHKDEEEDGD